MEYFKMDELCKSLTAEKLGIDNTPSPNVKINLLRLVGCVLDPLRSWYKKPITVNSGYRSVELNKAVCGVSTSQHTIGEAADITAGSEGENFKLFNHIRLHMKFDQVILEFGGAWVHVSYTKANRGKALESYRANGVTIYRTYTEPYLND
jgi:hypothetical protein